MRKVHPVIRFYLESAVSDRRVMETTVPQMQEKLERICGQLEKNYGVSFGDEKITGLTPIILRRWFNEASASWKPATANNYVCTVNPFLRWAFEMEMTEKDLSSILHTAKLPDPDSLPPEEQPKDKYYTHEQVSALLHDVKGHNLLRDRAIMALILYSGFRVSEVCALTIGQVMHVPHGTVRLRRKGGAWKEAKVSEELYPWLEAYLATRKDKDDPNAPLFITTHGLPCTRTQIYRALSSKQKVLDLATGPHALRHTAISEVNNKYGALAARDFANHKNLVVTNRYSHTTEEQRQNAANSLCWQ